MAEIHVHVPDNATYDMYEQLWPRNITPQQRALEVVGVKRLTSAQLTQLTAEALNRLNRELHEERKQPRPHSPPKLRVVR